MFIALVVNEETSLVVVRSDLFVNVSEEASLLGRFMTITRGDQRERFCCTKTTDQEEGNRF